MNNTNDQTNPNERPVIDKRPRTTPTPQQPGTDKSCGLQLLTLQEVLQNILKNAEQACTTLENTDSPDIIHTILDKIQGYQVDSRVPQNIQHSIEDIRGSVRAMRLHDITRLHLCDILRKFISSLKEAIAQEEHNHKVDEARRIFLFMAEHAEEFVDWMEKMKQKQ